MKSCSLAAAGLVAALSLSAHAAPVPCGGQPGSVSDPAGDTWQPGNPDIVCASAQVANGQIVLREAFGAGFDARTTSASFYLDTDQNAATGATDNRTPGLGVDFVATFGATDFGPGLLLWNSTLGWSAPAIAFQLFDDGYALSIPLAMLGTNGAVNFAGLAVTQIGGAAFTVVQDFTAVATAAVQDVPEPSSAALALAALGALAAARALKRRRVSSERCAVGEPALTTAACDR